MRAAVVSDTARPPRFGEFADPVAEPGEVLVRASFAARSTLTKVQAAGRHYRSAGALPFVPGVDGVGRLDDGTRVFFAFPRSPFGSMAELVPVRREHCVALPDDLDDALAAGGANAGMSSMAALLDRAKFVAGESVLVQGATGTSGRLAVRIAKHLGARSVVVTGRNPEVLRQLRTTGADAAISLVEPDLVARLREALHDHEIDVVLDYLWGAPAGALFQAISGTGGALAERRVRFVQIGSSAGDELPLSAKALRSSGIELLGSGLGSVSHARLVERIGEFFRAVGPGAYRLAAEVFPLAEVEASWNVDPASGDRVVYAW